MKEKLNDKYKVHKTTVNGGIYLTKIDKKTNRQVYKKQFTVSANGIKKTLKTKTWQTSITKVEHEIEKTRVAYRDGLIKKDPKSKKHLYSDIVKEYHKLEVDNCTKQNKSYEVIDKFISNNNKYVLSGKYPNFKNKYVEDLTIQDIKQLKKDINAVALKNGLSKLTVSHIFTNVDRALKYCAEMMYIDDTIISNIRIEPLGKKRNKKKTNNILLKNEFDFMMKVFDKDFKFYESETLEQTEYRKKLYSTFFTCAFYLGFRKGEGFALTWKDFQQDKIYVNSTLNTKNVKKYLKTHTSRIINPKTDSSIRKIKTPHSIKKCLNEWKEYCQSLGMDISDDKFIFVELNEKHFNQTTFRNRFNKIIEESKVQKKYNKHLTIHGFRHSCCSFFIQKLREKDQDISLREIQIQVGKYLGHSDEKMVSEVYMHLYPNDEGDIMNKLLNEI